ncbi:MAG: CNNM domain-containing protein [Fuerstiella sp.]|jgi:CBS domain containing-hemolysin-like protein|nr:CNNM domain-containing protein [Fuerstiella sp.]
MSDLADSLHIWLPGTFLMLLLMMCSAFFSASETAFFFLSREQIRRFTIGNRRQRMVAALMADPDRLLTAVLFWNLLINLAYFSVGIVVMQKLSTGGFTFVAGVLSILNLVGMIVLGEVIPKSTAVVFRQMIASAASWPLAAAVAVLDPVIPALGKTARILRRSFWPHVRHEPHLQPEDLEKAIDASATFTTDLLEIEQQVLHNILDLNELAVEEVMRPRNLSVAVEPDDTLQSLSVAAIANADYLLIKEPDSDIFTRAVALARITGRADVTFAELAEPVVYVPWCASLAYVLAELRNRYSSVAIVVHEHGEIVGTVSYEDLLETVLSAAPSRTRRVLRREPMIEIGQNRYHAEGLVTLRYLCRHLRIPFDGEDESLNTLAGLFHDELERMPEVGDRIVWEGWIFTAIEVTPRGQLRALIAAAEYSADQQKGEA